MQIKEFLDTEKGYVLVKDTCKRSEDWIEVPDGAECLTVCDDEDKNKWYLFWRGDCKFCVGYDNDWYDFGSVSSMTEYLDAWDGSARIVWQRPQQPEPLPFVDDEVQSINDQYAEIEQVRQQSIDATLAERQSTYGGFVHVANTTGKLFAEIKNGKNAHMLPYAHEEALHMICSKIARIVNGDFNHIDSWHDIGGYAKLIENLIKENNNG